MAIKISGSTIIDDSRNIVNAGVVTATSFDGDGSALTGVGIGTQGSVNTSGIVTSAFLSNPSIVSASVTLDSGTNNYGVFGPLTVSVGATITVGAGNTFVIV